MDVDTLERASLRCPPCRNFAPLALVPPDKGMLMSTAAKFDVQGKNVAVQGKLVVVEGICWPGRRPATFLRSHESTPGLFLSNQGVMECYRDGIKGRPWVHIELTSSSNTPQTLHLGPSPAPVSHFRQVTTLAHSLCHSLVLVYTSISSPWSTSTIPRWLSHCGGQVASRRRISQ